jgi:hypothetical protein
MGKIKPGQAMTVRFPAGDRSLVTYSRMESRLRDSVRTGQVDDGIANWKPGIDPAREQAGFVNLAG